MPKCAAKHSVVACSVLSLLVLSACTGKNPASPAAKEEGANRLTGSETKTVTLSVMTSDRFLEAAKQKFEATHPGIRIEIKEYAASPAPVAGDKGKIIMTNTKPDPKNIEKYVNTVSAELMSGKASDLIVVSGLPYKKYADKKSLENIGDLMSKDASFQIGNYYTGMFDAMKYNGALYAVPVKVGLNLWLGNQAATGSEKIDYSKWTWEEFKKLAGQWATDKNKDGKPDVYPLAISNPIS
ncbi:hypothetical protein LJK87_39345 [Paenibacillus sp. P25]|nr:hypothetical protein LJK87_39345 [Paenibacillus sp. P25]